jgi:hypothetical protein
MIQAYLTAFPMLYEGEDIEVRYCLCPEGVTGEKQSVFLEYMKPTVVGLNAVLTLLMKLEPYREDEITILINDDSLYELIKGASTTKNGDILKAVSKTKKQLARFPKASFINVTRDKSALAKWKEILED